MKDRKKVTSHHFSSFLALLTLITLTPVWSACAEKEHDHSVNANELKLSLNVGKKWVADKHTADSVAVMITVIEEFEMAKPGHSVENFRKLGNQLDENLHGLIEGCTMKGPDHDQLHIWIALLAPNIQTLKESDTIESARVSFEAIAHRLAEFGKYFEFRAPAETGK